MMARPENNLPAVAHDGVARVAKPILNASRVVAGIGQDEAAGVPEHVCVDREGEAGVLADDA